MADCAALEMLCTGNGTGGSNPPLSAFRDIALVSPCIKALAGAILIVPINWDNDWDNQERERRSVAHRQLPFARAVGHLIQRSGCFVWTTQSLVRPEEVNLFHSP